MSDIRKIGFSDILLIVQVMTDYGLLDVKRHPTNPLKDEYTLNEEGLKVHDFLNLYLFDPDFKKLADSKYPELKEMFEKGKKKEKKKKK